MVYTNNKYRYDITYLRSPAVPEENKKEEKLKNMR